MTEVRVLQVLGHSAGGIARHVGQLVELLDGRDGLALEIAGPHHLPLELPKQVHPLEIPTGMWGHRRAAARLRAILDDGHYDVVHAHGLRAGIDAALAARRRPLPVVTTVHNLVQPEVAGRLKAPLYRRAEVLCVRLSDHVFTVSEQIARHLRIASRQARNVNKIEVLHLGIGEPPVVTRGRDQVRAELGVPGDGSLVVTVSRLAPQKAVHVWLDALARLPDEVTGAVVGEGPLRDRLEARARALGID
ncbi:MAG: glycosyltransferase family 4 protein, partial [Actinomycetota bacterium]|nr:glycosyltransferase family 4 protein [Actinomycetota bacterium]